MSKKVGIAIIALPRRGIELQRTQRLQPRPFRLKPASEACPFTEQRFMRYLDGTAILICSLTNDEPPFVKAFEKLLRVLIKIGPVRHAPDGCPFVVDLHQRGHECGGSQFGQTLRRWRGRERRILVRLHAAQCPLGGILNKTIEAADLFVVVLRELAGSRILTPEPLQSEGQQGKRVVFGRIFHQGIDKRGVNIDAIAFCWFLHEAIETEYRDSAQIVAARFEMLETRVTLQFRKTIRADGEGKLPGAGLRHESGVQISRERVAAGALGPRNFLGLIDADEDRGGRTVSKFAKTAPFGFKGCMKRLNRFFWPIKVSFTVSC
jgi:hypothetical protein